MEKITLIRSLIDAEEKDIKEEIKKIPDDISNDEKENAKLFIRHFPQFIENILGSNRKHMEMFVILVHYLNLKEQTIFSYVYNSLEKLKTLKQLRLIPENTSITKYVDNRINFLYDLRYNPKKIVDHPENYVSRDKPTREEFVKMLKTKPADNNLTEVFVDTKIYHNSAISTSDEIDI